MKLFSLRPLAVLLFAVCAGLCAAQSQDGSPPQQPQPQTAPPAPDGSEGQPAQGAPTPAKPQFFAGTVTTIDSHHIIVSRTLVGKAPETRTFLIQAKTKVSRTLRPKQRVTVRYEHLPEGDVALEVQVRLQRAPRTS